MRRSSLAWSPLCNALSALYVVYTASRTKQYCLIVSTWNSLHAHTNGVRNWPRVTPNFIIAREQQVIVNLLLVWWSLKFEYFNRFNVHNVAKGGLVLGTRVYNIYHIIFMRIDWKCLCKSERCFKFYLWVLEHTCNGRWGGPPILWWYMTSCFSCDDICECAWLLWCFPMSANASALLRIPSLSPENISPWKNSVIIDRFTIQCIL